MTLTQFQVACAELEHFVLERVAQLSLTVVPTPTAPSTFEDLVSRAREVGLGYREVFDGGGDNIIYSSTQANYAFRAWHDFVHLGHDQDFSLGGELAVFAVMAQELLARGASSDCIQVLHAEIVGQSQYYMYRHTYVENQPAFDLTYIRDPWSALADDTTP